MIIAITGPDGSGKSTAAAKVCALLEAAHGPGSVRIASAWDAVGASGLFRSREEVSRYFNGLEPQARCLFILHAMSQSVALAKKSDAKFILIDGHFYKYAASELAYGTPQATVLGACQGFEKPDQVFYLGIDPESAWARKEETSSYERGGAEGRESFLEFQKRMLAAWQLLDRKFGPWHHLSPFNTPDETAGAIVQAIVVKGKQECAKAELSPTPSS
jgi:thymidylate kinase